MLRTVLAGTITSFGVPYETNPRLPQPARVREQVPVAGDKLSLFISVTERDSNLRELLAAAIPQGSSPVFREIALIVRCASVTMEPATDHGQSAGVPAGDSLDFKFEGRVIDMFGCSKDDTARFNINSGEPYVGDESGRPVLTISGQCAHAVRTGSASISIEVPDDSDPLAAPEAPAEG